MKIFNILKNKLKNKKMSKIKVGQNYKFQKDCTGKPYSNCGLVNGTMVTTISRYDNGNGTVGWYVRRVDACGNNNNNIFLYDYELVPVELTLSQLQETLAEKKVEIQELETQIEFITQNGLDIFNEKEYQAYQVLKIMGINDIRKAKEIVAILK